MFILRNACRALAVSVLWIAQSHAATIFNFADFSNCASLQVNGDAACTGGVLRVTPALFDQSGSAFSTALIPLGAGAQFSTSFSFRMTGNDGDDNDGAGADGIVFAVQPVASTVGGSGGGIGYDGIPTSLGTNVLIIIPGATTTGGVRGGLGSVSTLTVDDARDIEKRIGDISLVTYASRSVLQVVHEHKNWNTIALGTTTAIRAQAVERRRQGGAVRRRHEHAAEALPEGVHEQ